MKRILDCLERLIRIVTTCLFFGIAGLIAVQVFTRYVMNNSLSWTEQAARAMFVWMILLYASVLVRRSTNLGFDILVNKMSKVPMHICKFISEILILAFAAFWAFHGFMLCLKFAGFRFSGISVPYDAVYSAEPVGALLIVIFSIELLVNHIKELTKKELRA
jgi:TRAP-type C4-dicarboxylate transport system permease small subunit